VSGDHYLINIHTTGFALTVLDRIRSKQPDFCGEPEREAPIIKGEEITVSTNVTPYPAFISNLNQVLQRPAPLHFNFDIANSSKEH
jgi:hypothetical protein